MKALAIIVVALLLVACDSYRNLPPEMGNTINFGRAECKEVTLATTVHFQHLTRVRIECTRIIHR